MSNEEEENIVSELTDFESLLSLNAGTSSVIGLLRELSKVTTDSEVFALFDGINGPAYEQIVCLSQWPVDTSYNMGNVHTLKHLILWEE